MVNNRAMVPLRGIFEELGAEVKWDAKASKVIATKEDATIVLKIGVKKARVDGEIVKIDVPPLIIDEKTYVPLRFVSEALGAFVHWDGENYVATISTETKEIYVYFATPQTDNEKAALNIVKRYYKYNSTLSYSVENLDDDTTFLVKVRTGSWSLKDAFIIGTYADSEELYIDLQLSRENPSEFWSEVEFIRTDEFS